MMIPNKLKYSKTSQKIILSTRRHNDTLAMVNNQRVVYNYSVVCMILSGILLVNNQTKVT